jgi:hypothetical protein
MSIEDIVNKFSEEFKELLLIQDSTMKQRLNDIYNDKFKLKLTEFLKLIIEYYHNVFRNKIRYYFNHARYSLLISELTV